MTKLLILAFYVLGLSALCSAQVGGTRVPAPTPNPTPDFGPELRRARDISKRSDELRMTENFPAKTDEDWRTYNELIRPIYRESTKEEREILAPTEAVAGSYTTFLSNKNTAITRLAADIGCFPDDDVVSAKPECANYSMPGAGSSYSFRVDDYRIRRLADLNFSKDRLEALGTLSHGIMVYLGDVPIEEVTLESEGLKYLLDIKPSSNFAQAGEFADKLVKGFKKDDFVYASVMKAIPGRTYVLRSIAYQGELLKAVKGIVYNELEFDERRDIVVAFRVAAMNPGEDLTIVWKELRNKKAPKLTSR